ncbi:hypothetical protein BJX62DRAFT_195379 [Aspergillus germanicus]
MIWQYGHGWLGVAASVAASNLEACPSADLREFASQAVRRQNPSSCSIKPSQAEIQVVPRPYMPCHPVPRRDCPCGRLCKQASQQVISPFHIRAPRAQPIPSQNLTSE